MNKKNILSACIVTYNVEKYADKCLSSLLSYTSPALDLEILVIDNHSSDHTVAMIRDKYPQIDLIASEKNLGFSAANNVLLKKCRGDYILLLNPDTIVEKDSLDMLVDYLKTHPECGIIGPKLLNEDRSLQNGLRKFPNAWVSFIKSSPLKHLKIFKRCVDQRHMRHYDLNQSGIVDQVSGAAFMFSRPVFNKLGLLDSQFYIYFEEVDYCKRAYLEGLNVYYLAEAQIIHFGGKSANSANAKMMYIYLHSQLKYFKKHLSPVHYLIFISIFKTMFLSTLFADSLIDFIFIPLTQFYLKLKPNPKIQSKLTKRISKSNFRKMFIKEKLSEFIFF